MDNPTEIARSDIDAVVATLQNNNADFVTEMLEGTPKIGTGPVRDCYIALGQSNLIGQLENVQGFISKAQYPNDKDTLPSEWGNIGNTRIFLSSRGSITASSSLLGADVYNIFISGQEAYCSIDLDGSSAQYIYHPPGLTKTKSTTNVDAQGRYKSSLIDSEAYSESHGDEAQAEAEMLLAA